MKGKKDSWLKILWRLFYPLLLYIGISFALELIVSVLLVAREVANVGMAGLTTEQLSLLLNNVLETYLRMAYYMAALAAAVTLPFLYLFYRKDKKRRMGFGMEISYCRASAMEYVLIGVVAFGACIGGNNLIMGSGLVELDESFQQISEILYSAPLWIQLIGTVLLVPLCEEMVFRGLMYNRMKEYMPVGMAMIVSALVFGMYHGNLVQFVYATALGVFMAYVYEKYHSFFASYLFHAVANLISVLITETGIFDFMYTSRIMMLISGALGVAVAVIGVRMMKNMVHLEPKDPISKVEL